MTRQPVPLDDMPSETSIETTTETAEQIPPSVATGIREDGLQPRPAQYIGTPNVVKLADQKSDLGTLLGLTILYFVTGKLGLMLAFVHASATAVWPPTGIALAGLLMLGYRFWPAISSRRS